MSEIKKILFVTLSNIGDVVLTLPALDALRGNFPEAEITVISGERPAEIFRDNPFISKFISYDKRAKLKEKLKLFSALSREKFDLVVDLRNSLIGALLLAKYRISPYLRIPGCIKHMKERHLYKIKRTIKTDNTAIQNKSLYISPGQKERINEILKENNIREDDKLIVISAGALSHTKRWPKENFIELARRLIKEFSLKIVLVGSAEDAALNQYLTQHIGLPVLDLSAKTRLTELAYLLSRASLLISNDSATAHIASYLNIPVVAIFGITDDEKYGPWSKNSTVVKKEIFCRPCQKAQCRFGNLKCMSLIKVDDVLSAVRNLFLVTQSSSQQIANIKENFKRILISRTDRIGDVLLSTPVIKALRDKYPHAYIAMMVSGYAKDVVEKNPCLDEVIILDKDTAHKGWWDSIKFTQNLRSKKFDLVLILHPTKRVHLITFLAGIPARIGYDRKLGFLLTHRIKHTKQFGEKHELEYNLDLLNCLGIEPRDRNLFMPIRPESEEWLSELFKQIGINSQDKLLAINPAASCPSKIWPVERFAQAADRLVKEYGFKILVIGGPKDIRLADNLIKNMCSTAINLAGKTSVTQLASLLKRCALFISNDSGPVHIASALGTPVISIFGRNQQGLSPKRWGPLGKQDKFLHKAACIECLAHNCKKQFACLKAISVEDVVNAADEILK